MGAIKLMLIPGKLYKIVYSYGFNRLKLDDIFLLVSFEDVSSDISCEYKITALFKTEKIVFYSYPDMIKEL